MLLIRGGNNLRLLIISDSHGNKDLVKEIIMETTKIDYVLFAGDGIKEIKQISSETDIEIIAVSGNCDNFSKGSSERLIVICGKRIFLTHGHKYNVKFGLDKLFYRAKELKADIVIFGHTHKPESFIEKGVLFFNPGSILFSIGRETGTFGIINIEENGKVHNEIIELHK